MQVTVRKFHKRHEILALVKDANAIIDRIEGTNPFLAQFLRVIAVDRHNMYHPGYYGVIAIIEVFEKTGLIRELTSPQAFDERPDDFWRLMDEAKREDCLAAIPRAVLAILKLYASLDRQGFLDESFGNSPKSPKDVLRLSSFRNFLLHKFVRSEYTFKLSYSIINHPRFLTIKYNNPDLAAMVTDAFSRCLNKCNRRSNSLDVLYEIEKWFGKHAASIHDYRDLNEQKLVTAIESIRHMYEGKLRINRMQFLFHLYSVQMLQHPEHHFFEHSHLWSPNIILDRRIPVHIAKGYSFAVFGQTNRINQTEGILMVVRDAQLMSTNGRNNSVFSFDLSSITIPEYWRAASHYVIQVSFGKISYVKDFLIWLQNGRAENKKDLTTIDSHDLYFYRCKISEQYTSGKQRNQIISELKRFLRWAGDEGYFSIMPDALDELKKFECIYIVDPKPIGKKDLELLLNGLHEKGKENLRFLLSEALCRLLLYKDIRPGQLCKMTVSELIEGSDGNFFNVSKSKNGGYSPELREFEKRYSDILRQVMKLTAPIREKCPRGSYDKYIFIYPEPSCSHIPFGIMSAAMLERDMDVVCSELGLPNYRPGNIRDTYMTAVTSFSRKHNLTELQKSILTRHANKISTKSYVSENLEEILMYGENINLGNV